MNYIAPLGFSLIAFTLLITGCGSDGTTAGTEGAGGASVSGATGSASTGASSSSGAQGGASASSSGSGVSASSSSSSSSSGSGGGGGVPDPNVDGPYTYKEIDAMITVASTGHTEAAHAAYPVSGPSAGPYPVILVAHGFQLPISQYYGYVKRLASFGYVAIAPDFPVSLFAANNVENAKDVLGALDWAAGQAMLKADVNTVGATGHSLGGKVSLLAATMDPRVKASITLDPVDSAVNCSPQNCPDVSSLMPTLKIPTGFVGETTDAMGGFMPCAPAADNFTTFYAGTNSPSLEVTALGANHMSFLDDVVSCGFLCSVCNMATAPNAQVNSMARALVVAFYERHIRGNAGYDAYLTGAQAQARYVTTNQATIVSK